jgi:catechol 2,3-dioxygenase-like lactoylglutathione lyase family enzyme
LAQFISAITLVVRAYDEAIAWYCEKLKFQLIEDKDMGGGKRWVVIAPTGGEGTRLLLAEARGPQQIAAVGNQAGGRVFMIIYTNDFNGDHAHMQAHGVRFCEEPRHEIYGKVVVFEDLYGNRFDLLQPAA